MFGRDVLLQAPQYYQLVINIIMVSRPLPRSVAQYEIKQKLHFLLFTFTLQLTKVFDV